MGVEGHIAIHLTCTAGQVSRVNLKSSRPVQAARMLEGKEIVQALQFLPDLFAVCGTAQACAGVRACEQALGRQAGEREEVLRDALVDMETTVEHCWRILLDWPQLLDELPVPQAMAPVMALQKAYRSSLTGGENPLLLAAKLAGNVASLPLALLQRFGLLLQQHIFGMPATEWLELVDPSALRQWALTGTTIATRMLRQIEKRQWGAVGCCAVGALPELDPEQLHGLLEDDQFIEQPMWQGSCYETSAQTRVNSPLLEALRSDSHGGNGLLVRLVARLTELAQLARRCFSEFGSSRLAGQIKCHNPGIGQSQAARGLLLHRVQISGERISRYQILAPTEWNFHPRGVVAQSLVGLSGDKPQIEQQARLLITAIDPCVGFTLDLAEEAV